MNEKELKTFCDKWADAWYGNRPELLRSFYSMDAFYRDPHKVDGLKGDDILPYFQKLLKHNPEWRWKIIEIFPHATGACVKWQASIPVSGGTITENGVDILEISKISLQETKSSSTEHLGLKHCRLNSFRGSDE